MVALGTLSTGLGSVGEPVSDAVDLAVGRDHLLVDAPGDLDLDALSLRARFPAKIRAFITGWNTRCHPFIWTKPADQVLDKVKCKRNSLTSH